MSKQHNKSLRMVLTIFITTLLVLGLSGALLAADFRTGDTVTIDKGQVIDDDLVLTGNMIIIDGTINGDLIAIGGDITVNGRVKGSLISGARSLVMNGTVDGSLYFGGAMMNFGPQAVVERNLFFGGYSFEAERNSLVKRDNLIGAYQAVLNGEIQRDLKAGVSALQINGQVGGDVSAEVGSPQDTPMPQFWFSFAGQNLPPALTPGLRIGSDAQIAGKLNYSSPTEQRATILATPDKGVAFTPVIVPTTTSVVTAPPSTQATLLTWLWGRLRELVSLLMLGLLALWLLPKWFERSVENARNEILASCGWGFMVTVVGYILALLAFVLLIVVTVGLGSLTLGGLATGFFFTGFTGISTALTIFTLLIAYGSKLVVLYPVSQWLLGKITTSPIDNRVWILLPGVVLYVLVAGIPYLGFVVGLFATMIGIGAMWLIFRNRPKAANIAQPPPKMVLMPT